MYDLKAVQNSCDLEIICIAIKPFFLFIYWNHSLQYDQLSVYPFACDLPSRSCDILAIQDLH